jgi:peptidoglycan-associated lipoprotein
MTLRLSHVLLIVAALAAAACTNPNRFGAGGGGGADGGFGGTGGIGVSGLGDPSDPRSVAYFNQTVGDRVFFAVDQSVLTPDAQATLRAQAQWLNANPQYSAIIEGHADEQGTREYNLALGERRANAVREFLISQGVAGSRLRTISYGKERPVQVCSNESCWRVNRRAVTVITTGAGV